MTDFVPQNRIYLTTVNGTAEICPLVGLYCHILWMLKYHGSYARIKKQSSKKSTTYENNYFDCTIIPCANKRLDSKYTAAKTRVTVSIVSSQVNCMYAQYLEVR